MSGLPSSVRPPRPGDPLRFGAYDVVGFLGEGGMGLVFLGRGPDGTLVAIKVVRAEFAREPEFRARFRREAESAMRVPRFCTAEVLAADPDAAEPYLVTEYIDGPTLEEAVKTSGPLRRAELDQLGVSMAAALTGIHGAGVVHRDLKPSNVLLSRMGPRVIDFGIAGAVDGVRLTAEGQALGTPAYMAPEQLNGKAGPASDVWAWGGVMVFAATGQRPFGARTLPELAAQIMHSQPDLYGLTGPLRQVIAAALTKDERLRPAPERLLQMLGVSGTNSEFAVQTRLAAGPVPMSATRLDTPGAATGADAISMRFGPGVQAAEPNEATRMWRAGRPPRRRRLRSILGGLVTLGVFTGVAAWLIMQNMPDDLTATGVQVKAVKRQKTCGDVDLTGTVTSNGRPGWLTYQWKLSDRKQPEAAKEIHIAEGDRTLTLPFLWQFEGHGRSAKYTATLTVTGTKQTNMKNSATFTYSCPR